MCFNLSITTHALTSVLDRYSLNNRAARMPYIAKISNWKGNRPYHRAQPNPPCFGARPPFSY